MKRWFVLALSAALAGACSAHHDTPTTQQREQPATCYRQVAIGITGELRDLDDHDRILVGPRRGIVVRGSDAVAGQIWDAGAITILRVPERFAGDELVARATDMNDRGEVAGAVMRYERHGSSIVPVETVVLLFREGVAEELFSIALDPATVYFPSFLRINARGHVIVGLYDPTLRTTERGFLFRDGAATELGFLPIDLGDDDTIVGFERGAATRPVLWREGTRTVLSPVDGARDLQLFDRIFLGPGGLVAMNWFDAAGEERAYTWEDGVRTEVGSADQHAFVGGIGPGDVVVGATRPAPGTTHAFVLESGVLHELSTPSGERTVARAIDAEGRVVGETAGPDAEAGPRPVFWEAGMMTELPLAAPPGYGATATRINANAFVAGTSSVDEEERRPLLWRASSCGGGQPPPPPPVEEPGEQ